MHGIAPSEKQADNAALGKRLSDADDQFRAKSGLTFQEYTVAVFASLFLRFAAQRSMRGKTAAKRGHVQGRRRFLGDEFVSSSRFVAEYKKSPAAGFSIHGIEGDIRKSGIVNSHFDYLHDAPTRFDSAQDTTARAKARIAFRKHNRKAFMDRNGGRVRATTERTWKPLPK